MSHSLKNKTAISGVGRVQFKRGTSPESQHQCLVRAIIAAAEDAGLDASEIDGFSSYGDDTNIPVKLMPDLRTKELRWSSSVWGGGGGGICAAVGQAAAAVATGQAEVVAVYRALVEDISGRLAGAVMAHHMNDHYYLAGVVAPVQLLALRARHLMESRGIPRSCFEAMVEVDYYHARRNPDAASYQNNFQIEDYRESRWIAEPYKLYDCSRENDGAGVVLVVSAERARDLRKKPVNILGVVQGATELGRDLLENDNPYETGGFEAMVPRLYEQTGLRPKDIDVAQIYENMVGQGVASIIGHGFCEYEEAAEFIRFDNLIAPSGRLPINTAGGNVAQGFIHGIGVLIEGVQQLRGESANPVPDAKTCLVAGGCPAPVTSSLVLGRDL